MESEDLRVAVDAAVTKHEQRNWWSGFLLGFGLTCLALVFLYGMGVINITAGGSAQAHSEACR